MSRMRALLIAPRLPGTGFTGDRMRSQTHLDALKIAGFHVTLVGGLPGGTRAPGSGGPEDADVVVAVPLESRRIPFSLLRYGVSGDPLQAALNAGPWSEALSALEGRFHIVVWSLVRMWPHLRGRLPDAPIVLDYIDALAAAAAQASQSDEARWRRMYWKVEAPRLARAEREAAIGTALRLATTARDAAALPEGTQVFAHGVELKPLYAGAREPVVAFSGRLMYRPNELAVKRLVRDIWPHVRRRFPDARLALGGADAPHWIRRLHGQNGVEVHSPVADMCTFLREARVVAAPVELGLGTPNKLFEALEAGAPVVASAALSGRSVADDLRPPALVAENDE
ncbi:MAG: glycosyltransferase [Thermoanaerobaculia bacterium]